MNLLSDIITYIRRIIKAPSNAVISDNLLIDYINRFWLMDVDARMQLYDLKKKYQFQTVPGVDKYNMPLYSMQTQPGDQDIAMFPLYQGFTDSCFVNGIPISFSTDRSNFFSAWPNVVQYLGIVGTGDGTTGPYTLTLPISPATPPLNPPYSGLLRGHIDITGIIATGNNVDPPITDSTTAAANIASIPVTSVESAFYLTTIDDTGASMVIADSGWFLQGDVNYGLLMNPGKAPYGNTALPGGYTTTSNTVNYFNNSLTVTFPSPVPAGMNINAQCFYFQSGLPRGVLYYNNTLTFRSPPALQYLVEIDAYLSPAAFLNTTEAVPFGYMSEYIARGAAQKILSDTGDWEQYDRYEPLLLKQENLVWKRSQRQKTATRTQTIYGHGLYNGTGTNNNFGGGGGII